MDSYQRFYFLEPPTIELDPRLLSEAVQIRAGNTLRLEAEISGKPEPNVGIYL